MQDTLSPVVTKKLNEKAQIMAAKLPDTLSRKKAYVDFTACLFAIDYFHSNGIRVNSQRSIFQCLKLYKDFEVVDIYCNSHMLFVVNSYGVDFVKVPLAHKKYDILPEAYVAVELKAGMQDGEIKGAIFPEDFENAEIEGKYYRFNSDSLHSTDELFEKIRKYAGIRPSIGRHLDCMKLFESYVNNTISEENKKSLIEHILTCETCKKRLMEMIEFDSAAKNAVEPIIDPQEENIPPANVYKKTPDNKTDVLTDGTLDTLYKNGSFSIFKDNALDYKNDVVKKISRLVWILSGVIVFIIVSAVFLFNLPKKEAEDLPSAADLNSAQNLVDTSYNSASSYDITTPKIRNKSSYMTISKVSWEVNSDKIKDSQKKFLQSAGKSIRLNLQNDLLLSSSASVNNGIKFEIKFSNDGADDTIKVVQSSGSGALDDIIRKSVKETLYYMRPPRGAFSGRKGIILSVEF